MIIFNAHAEQVTKHTIDGIALGTAFSAFVGWLPSVAALFSIVWLGMQMVINWDKFVEKLKKLVNKGDA